MTVTSTVFENTRLYVIVSEYVPGTDVSIADTSVVNAQSSGTSSKNSLSLSCVPVSMQISPIGWAFAFTAVTTATVSPAAHINAGTPIRLFIIGIIACVSPPNTENQDLSSRYKHQRTAARTLSHAQDTKSRQNRDCPALPRVLHRYT